MQTLPRVRTFAPEQWGEVDKFAQFFSQTYPAFKPDVGIPLPLGIPGQGCTLITADGVAFYGATMDYYLRAYDVSDGKELWQARLPVGGQATPMSYRGKDGRQYIVIFAGGHGSLGARLGDSVMAYALPLKP